MKKQWFCIFFCFLYFGCIAQSVSRSRRYSLIELDVMHHIPVYDQIRCFVDVNLYYDFSNTEYHNNPILKHVNLADIRTGLVFNPEKRFYHGPVFSHRMISNQFDFTYSYFLEHLTSNQRLQFIKKIELAYVDFTASSNPNIIRSDYVFWCLSLGFVYKVVPDKLEIDFLGDLSQFISNNKTIQSFYKLRFFETGNASLRVNYHLTPKFLLALGITDRIRYYYINSSSTKHNSHQLVYTFAINYHFKLDENKTRWSSRTF